MDTNEDEYNSNNIGDDCMSGMVINCDSPFISTKRELKCKPMSAEAQERREFIRNHEFSISVDKKTMNMKVTVKEK